MSASRSEQAEVVRLKELLFREERHSLAAIRDIVEQHHDRIGTDERLTETVAEVLANSFKSADIKDHRELAGAVSPLVVSSIKREIVNSRDEMVEALYPIMGRLVSAYVSAAMRDVMESTNQKLESSLSLKFLRLRLKSLLTGRPYRELAMVESGSPRVRELLLIKRPSGVLVDRWLGPGEPIDGTNGTGSGQLMSGLLSAINDFANQAFAGGRDELRSLDIGGSRLFLRTSAAHLLAVRATGVSGRKVQRAIDNALVDILDSHANVLIDSGEPGAKSEIRTILPKTADRLGEALESERRKPVLAFALVALLILGLAGALGWYGYERIQTEQLKKRVASVIETVPAFSGYPLDITIGAGRRSVSITGLAPSNADAQALTGAIKQAIAPVDLVPRFAFVTNEDALHRALADLKALAERLRTLDQSLTRFAGRGDVQAVAALIPNLASEVEALSKRLDLTAQKPDVAEVSGDVAALSTEIAGLEQAIRSLSSKTEVTVLAETLAAVEKRLGSLSAKRDVDHLGEELAALRTAMATLPSREDVGAVETAVQTLAPEIDTLRKRLDDPRLRLAQRVATSAVFFDVGTNVLNRTDAEKLAADVADLAKRADADLRVVGYTDSLGNLDRNRVLAGERAAIVADMLVKSGLSRARLILVARPDGPRISDVSSRDGQSDRRVDIEIAYRGERSFGGGGSP